jgi:hypothetical protein
VHNLKVLVELFVAEQPEAVSSFASFSEWLPIISYACVPALFVWADTLVARFGPGIQSFPAAKGPARAQANY